MNRPIDSIPPVVDLDQLLAEFYTPAELVDLGSFAAVDGESVAQPHRQLLDHQSHMTVTVESYFHSPVDVHVLRSRMDHQWYVREILLETQRDRTIVQYGIVRLRYAMLAEPVWKEIESRSKPLGRVLIDHDVMRQVELVGLWSVQCGKSLASFFNVPQQTKTYGRTARIFCYGEPAIELLEIVRPSGESL